MGLTGENLHKGGAFVAGGHRWARRAAAMMALMPRTPLWSGWTWAVHLCKYGYE